MPFEVLAVHQRNGLPSHTAAARQSIRADLTDRLRHIAQDAEAFAACAEKLGQMAEEAAKNGTAVILQPQVQFLTGALARLQKDWGVVEHLQRHGALPLTPLLRGK